MSVVESVDITLKGKIKEELQDSWFVEDCQFALESTEAAVQRCSSKRRSENKFANLQEKSRLGIGVLLQIYGTFSEHLLLRPPLDGCLWK